MRMRNYLLALSLPAVLSACAFTPDNPTIDVAPPSGMSYGQFLQHRDFCVAEAKRRVAPTVSRRNTTGIIGGVVTTALGAGIGAAAGGGMGAALGAGSGAFAGTAGGALYSGGGSDTIQNAYNIAYLQCMQATKNDVFGQPQLTFGQSGVQPPQGPYWATPSSGPVPLTPGPEGY